jgi:hypothetical protein
MFFVFDLREVEDDVAYIRERYFRICLAPLEWGGAGEGGDEGLGALGAGGSQRCEDLPGARAVGCLVAAGDYASDYRGPQLTLGQIVGGIDFIVIEEGEKVIALFE